MALVPSCAHRGTSPSVTEAILPAQSRIISAVNGRFRWSKKARCELISSVMYCRHSSARCSNTDAALSRMSRRKAGFVCDHDSNAACAASTAACASDFEALQLRHIVLPLDGLVTSNNVEVYTSLPPIWRGIVYKEDASLSIQFADPLVVTMLRKSLEVQSSKTQVQEDSEATTGMSIQNVTLVSHACLRMDLVSLCRTGAFPLERHYRPWADCIGTSDIANTTSYALCGLQHTFCAARFVAMNVSGVSCAKKVWPSPIDDRSASMVEPNLDIGCCAGKNNRARRSARCAVETEPFRRAISGSSSLAPAHSFRHTL
jgi:hypothetical protein